MKKSTLVIVALCLGFGIVAMTGGLSQAADNFGQALDYYRAAIVISMGGIAFVLSILNVISSRYKTSDLDEIQGLKN